MNDNANRNSFHAAMNASKPVVTNAGEISGSITRYSVWNGLHPSTYAASSRSLGICAKKLVSTQTVNGSVKIRYVRISDHNVLYRPNWLTRSKSAGNTAMVGNIVIARIKYMTGSRPRKRKRPIAYAASTPMTSDISVTTVATTAEFASACRKAGLLSTNW